MTTETMSETVTVVGALIGDGFLYSAEMLRIDVDVESPRYWLGLRLAETNCPDCDCDDSGCETCDGLGVVTGEPFTLARYEVPRSLWGDWGVQGYITGDGYGDAGALAPYHVADVAEWDPRE